MHKIVGLIMGRFPSQTRHPGISNTWEITHISDYMKFIDFILSKAEPNDMWFLDRIVTGSAKKKLKKIAANLEPIPLTEDNIDALRAVLPTINVEKSFLEHKIGREGKYLLVSYDYHSCCWISKRIDIDTMNSAARECGFEFEDTRESEQKGS